MGTIWGPSGADRIRTTPMLAPWFFYLGKAPSNVIFVAINMMSMHVQELRVIRRMKRQLQLTYILYGVDIDKQILCLWS